METSNNILNGLLKGKTVYLFFREGENYMIPYAKYKGVVGVIEGGLIYLANVKLISFETHKEISISDQVININTPEFSRLAVK